MLDEQKDKERREELIEAIEKAFEGVQRAKTEPSYGAVNLHEARVVDDYGSEEERAAVRSCDSTTRWQDVPDQWIEHDLSDTFGGFLCSQSFWYYAPAFMIWTLKHYDQSDSNAVNGTVWAFRFTEGNEVWDRERFGMATHEQARVVARFLDYFAEDPKPDWCVDADIAKQALDQYWGTFL